MVVRVRVGRPRAPRRTSRQYAGSPPFSARSRLMSMGMLAACGLAVSHE